ncbi:Protein CBG18731 [Caenorhabditis briggsae]|uniref:Protein CBG18731 n=1 Tax=Caenorhabditis briggsae TaxID=6238 RepID=A8XU03_CAEBR|nr:Protein CBG18731 [Caenorhabditis briggsae]CAP36130.2 Protein CBG18731 [Caenorhabditis briggsae]
MKLKSSSSFSQPAKREQLSPEKSRHRSRTSNIFLEDSGIPMKHRAPEPLENIQNTLKIQNTSRKISEFSLQKYPDSQIHLNFVKKKMPCTCTLSSIISVSVRNIKKMSKCQFLIFNICCSFNHFECENNSNFSVKTKKISKTSEKKLYQIILPPFIRNNVCKTENSRLHFKWKFLDQQMELSAIKKFPR